MNSTREIELSSTHPHSHRHKHPHPAHGEFINKASGSAIASQLKTGVPASITLAQAILESGWGAHHVGQGNNYFGVKAHERHGKIDIGPVATGYITAATKEHVHGKVIKTTANFRKYSGMTDSFIDHGLFLCKNHRYHQIIEDFRKSGDSKAFAVGLQKAGYATDVNYAKLLIGIMDSNNLYRFDATAKEAVQK